MTDFDIEQLIADCQSDSDHARPFGSAHNDRRDAIRARLIAEGHPGDASINFAISREMEKEARDKLTFRQRQDLARWLGLKWAGAAKVANATPSLDRDDLEYLAARLRGVNDPDGLRVLSKIEALLRA